MAHSIMVFDKERNCSFKVLKFFNIYNREELTNWNDVHFIKTHVPDTPYRIPSGAQQRNAALNIASYICDGTTSLHLGDLAIVMYSMSVPGSGGKEKLFRHILASNENGVPIPKTTGIEYNMHYDVLANKWPSMKKALQEISNSEEPKDAAQDALNILGFYCLMWFRMLVHVSKAREMSIARYLDDVFRKVYRYAGPIHLIPLSAEKNEKLERSHGLRKDNVDARTMFSIILMRYLVEETSPSPYHLKIKKILLNTCLQQTKLNGMPTLKLFEQVKTQYHMSTATLHNILAKNHFKKNVDQVLDHYKQTEEGDCAAYTIDIPHWGRISSSKQHTWPWARLIEDSQLLRFTTERSEHLCALLAAILYQNPSGKDVIKMSFLKKERSFFDRSLSYAADFHKLYGPNSSEHDPTV